MFLSSTQDNRRITGILHFMVRGVPLVMHVYTAPDQDTLVHILEFFVTLLSHLGSQDSVAALRDQLVLSDGVDQVERLESVVIALFVCTPRLYLAYHLPVSGILLQVEHHAGLLLDDLGLLGGFETLLGGPVEHSVQV